jgi:hypothetical protein
MWMLQEAPSVYAKIFRPNCTKDTVIKISKEDLLKAAVQANPASPADKSIQLNPART